VDGKFDAANEDTVGSPDTVGCGRGDDAVIANRNDTVADNCERVIRVANPSPGEALRAAASSVSEGHRPTDR